MTDEPTSIGHSEAVENFLKAVYTLQQTHERVSTNILAEALDKTAPTVTDMAQRMVRDGLVDYQKYKGVILTAAGRALALKIIRRHRLIELYLVTELGYALDEVHVEAEALEHAVSDRFVEALAHKLGDPTADPHGDPIPAADGTITIRTLLSLCDVPIGLEAIVARLRTDSPDMLRHILDKGFRLGAAVAVLARDPFDGPVTVRLDDSEAVVGHNAACCVMVETAE